MEKHEIFDRSIALWGEDSQLGMLQEECAELIQAISKKKRGFADGDARIAEEIADVENLIEQTKRMLHITHQVTRIKQEKLDRLEFRMTAALAGENNITGG